jgi:hypothetical protein
MSHRDRLRSLLFLALGGILGSLITMIWERSPAMAQQNNPTPPATMQADIARLKDIAPPASHPMVDVSIFAANLWFAADKNNWPLANYYLGEMRNRMRWEVRLNPAPKGADGNPVDMAAILDGIEKGSLTKVKQVIDVKDGRQFPVEYKRMLEDCYSCHKTANRPYLRPMVPVGAPQPMVNLDPGANWPQ